MIEICISLVRYEDVHTNQVQEKLHEFGKKSGDSGRTTPVPSRHIGEVFAENKIGSDWKVKQHETTSSRQESKSTKQETSAKAGSSPWRTAPKGQEPSLKLVNVTVEKSATGGANIHISENAHAQMANFMQQECKKETKVSSASTTTTTTSMMSTSSSHMEQKSCTVESRLAQVEQKLTAVDSKLAQVPPKSPGPVRSAKTAQPAKEKGKPSSPAEIQTGEFTKASYSTSSSCSAEKVELKSSKIEEKKKAEVFAKPQQQQHVEPKPSTNISSPSSTSSGQIPMPVTQSWFEQQEQHQIQQSKTSTSSYSSSQTNKIENSITKTSVAATTPLPVLAGWFVEEQQQQQKQQEQQQQQEHHQKQQLQKQQQLQQQQQEHHQKQQLQQQQQQQQQQKQQLHQKQQQQSKSAMSSSEKQAHYVEKSSKIQESVNATEPQKVQTHPPKPQPLRAPEPPKAQPLRNPEPPKPQPTKIQEPAKSLPPKAPEVPKPVASNIQEQVKQDFENIEEVSKVEIIEIADQDDIASIEDAMKGKVRGNVAMFQQPGTFRTASPSGNSAALQDVESMRGKVGESKKAYFQRASSSDREEGSKQERTKELEAMLRARNESG